MFLSLLTGAKKELNIFFDTYFELEVVLILIQITSKIE